MTKRAEVEERGTRKKAWDFGKRRCNVKSKNDDVFVMIVYSLFLLDSPAFLV